MMRFGAWVLLGALAVASGPATALCPTARLISSQFQYVYTPGLCDGGYPCPGETSVSERLAGVFWVAGAGDPVPLVGNDNGTFPPRLLNDVGYYLTGWITNYPGYPAYLDSTWAAAEEIDGCPDFVDRPGAPGLCTRVLLTDSVERQGYFLIHSRQSDLLGNYDFSTPEGFLQLESIDRLGGDGFGGPVIAASLRLSDSRVAVTVNPPDPGAGVLTDLQCSDPVVGYRVYFQTFPRDGGIPFEREVASGWIDVDPSSDPVPVPIDQQAQFDLTCDGDSSSFVATALVFDSGFETPIVSANSAVVQCGPNAADVEDLRPRQAPGQRIELRNRRGRRSGRR